MQIDKVFEIYMKEKRELEVEEIKNNGGPERLLEKLNIEAKIGLSGALKESKIIKKKEIQSSKNLMII
jgi:hypothetical protein